MSTRLVELTTEQVWELRDDLKSRHPPRRGAVPAGGIFMSSVSWHFRVNCRPGAYVRLRHPTVSKHHGAIVFDEGAWWVHDGCSAYAVTRNGAPIESGGREALSHGDILGFGEVRLRFESTGPMEPGA